MIDLKVIPGFNNYMISSDGVVYRQTSTRLKPLKTGLRYFVKRR